MQFGYPAVAGGASVGGVTMMIIEYEGGLLMTSSSPFERSLKGDVDVARVRTEVNTLIAELNDPDSDASREAHEAGLERTDLTELEVSVEQKREGVEPITTTILIGLGVKFGASAAEKLWEKVLWPRLRKKFFKLREA